MIDNHEPAMPTGIQRTWPNLMTQEGVRGQEYNAWDRRGGNPPAHTVTLPFTRGLAGPTDFTPAIFDFSEIVAGTHPHSTLAKQLGEFVVIYSPLQMAADAIENYEGQPALSFIESCPTTWSKTLVPHGEIGKHITIARKERGGDRWFIGSITNEEARDLHVSLDFLDAGATYRAIIYEDAADADYEHNPYAMTIRQLVVTSKDTLQLKLARSEMKMKRSRNLCYRLLLMLAVVFFALDVSAQTTINGQVKDDMGEAVIGASIVVKGTSNGTVTDFDGNFTLKCQSGAKLVITYIGYTPQEVAAKDGMQVTLKEDVAQLNEVVVVGYGSMAKKEISSSVVQISKDQFNQGAASDAMALVAGKVAGLNVASSADANPNAMTDIQVRGAGSLSASNGPLVVIDGIAGGDLRNIATQDVESITVLKDAGSAAIYGTRGANGVILVTTKKGSGTAGVTNVTYDSYIALNIQKQKPDILSTDEFRRSRRGQDYGADTNWWDEITRPVSYSLNQYLSIDSSTKNGFFGLSLNYKKGNGLDIVSGREEYGARFVGEQRVLNGFLQFNSSLSARKVHEEWGNDGLFDTALTMNPTIPVKNPNGTYYQPNSPTDIHNPVNDLKENVSQGDRVYLLGNADVKLNILQTEQHNLNTSLSYALQYNDLKENFYTPTSSSESFWNGYAGRARINYQKWWTNRLEWLANYTMTLDKHQLKAVLGYSWERSKWEQSGNENMGFVYDALSYHGIANGTYLKDGKANLWAGSSESTLIGFFGRLNYNFNDMLYASASFRREGSTKFGSNTKWGNFPSASLAWEVTNTPVLKEAVGSIFQSLKPRISYGVTGRSDFNAYQSIATYSGYSAYLIDGQWINGYAPSLNANPDLAWEKSKAFNIGLDFVTLNNRLRGSIEYFDRRSEDLLYMRTCSTTIPLHSLPSSTTRFL